MPPTDCLHKNFEPVILCTDEKVANVCVDCYAQLPIDFIASDPVVSTSVFGGIVSYWTEEAKPLWRD
jgi:hypothetical protein